MTIFHLVLLKTSATISPDVRQNLAVGVDRLREIEGVTFVRHGDLAKEGFYSGYQDRAKGYNYSILVGLADKNALKKYDTDTLHVQIKSTCIVPSLDAGAKDPILVSQPRLSLTRSFIHSLLPHFSLTPIALQAL